MAEFINLITDFLSIELTLGGNTFNLGSILFFLIIIKVAYNRILGEFLERDYLNKRAGRHGFNSWEEYDAFRNYMGGDGGNNK